MGRQCSRYFLYYDSYMTHYRIVFDSLSAGNVYDQQNHLARSVWVPPLLVRMQTQVLPVQILRRIILLCVQVRPVRLAAHRRTELVYKSAPIGRQGAYPRITFQRQVKVS